MSKIRKLIEENSYFIIIITILFIFYVTYIGFYKLNNVYIYNFYVLSYDYGFISRGLIGSIFMFFNPFLKMNTLITILNIIYIIFLIFIAYILSLVIKKQKDKFIAFLTTMFCIFNPASFMLMITMNEFGRFDIFIFILSIISLILIYKRKLLFFIPIIFFIAMLIHQNFLFMYAPLILTIILYNWLKEKNKKWLLLFGVSFICLVILFILVTFYGNPKGFNNAEEFASVLQTKTDIPILSSYFGTLDAEYFQPINEHISLTRDRLIHKSIIDFVIAIILIISYLSIQSILCYQFLLKKNKFIWLLICSCFGSIVLFFIGVDFGRWFVAIINALVILFIYLIFDNVDTINNNITKVKKHLIFLLTILIIYIFLLQDTPFTAMDFNKINIIINRIKTFIKV